jgi:hypothetical protein
MLTTIHLTLRARSRWIRLLHGVFRGAGTSRTVGDIVNYAAAHRRRSYETAPTAAAISGSYLFVGHQEVADDRHVLVLSAFGQSNEGVVDIGAKPIWPNVIDAAVAAQHTSGSDRYTINSGKTEGHVSDETPSDGDQA